ncbi:motility associated factor glycosyltransferase family protein [Clostridium botulinum]|uniref:motility associated factor glycosyltransferase family protein n=1 Tax=Clostridium botulinum TaxID=1491 RepID=UPI0013CBBD47|nr:6-hydroxymethylpterin diphosphokinase MptE-like protein [Clostridium botulinum]MBY6836416.1 motility associated factor glycosyltransferase family protein [Clostridium botulinum]NFG64260.1 motility associated factor glycosyltransferase family protein [Clostridium botulinum]NFN18137.1 motility associated factor glycosyltransferase family protein [Clostridium botulinum]NFN47810.1 motility associated factor glycosyltransferase family protein [Clostridium botulinum]NFQ23032.1 motility associated
MNRKIEILNTRECNTTLLIENVFLHSKYYPMKEGEKFIELNEKFYKNKDVVMVYGLGLGYHIKELLKKCNDNCKIYIFDVDKEVIKIADNLGVLENVRKDKRVKIFENYSQKFLQDFVDVSQLVDDILIYKPSVNLLSDEYMTLKNIFQDYNVAKIAVERFSEVMKKNYDHNLKLKTATIKEFFNKINVKGETVIIVAAGPSLDYNINILKKLNGKVKIFSVGRALKTLMKSGIKPDMITIIDSQEVVYNQLKGYENLDIPLCFLSTASRWGVSNYNGAKYMFYNEKNKDNKDDIIINTGKTVAVATLDIAIKSGAKEIIFVGQDLGFLNNKSHAGTINDVPEDGIYKKVLSVNGGMINTNSGYMYFKRQIEKEIEENQNVRFINCSKGARIKGTIEIELEEVLQDKLI